MISVGCSVVLSPQTLTVSAFLKDVKIKYAFTMFDFLLISKNNNN